MYCPSLLSPLSFVSTHPCSLGHLLNKLSADGTDSLVSNIAQFHYAVVCSLKIFCILFLNQWHTGNSTQLRLCVRIREKHFELVGTERLNIFRTLGQVTSVSTSVSYRILEEGERGGTHPRAPVSLYLCINQQCDKAASHSDDWAQVEVGWWSLVVWHEVCR